MISRALAALRRPAISDFVVKLIGELAVARTDLKSARSRAELLTAELETLSADLAAARASFRELSARVRELLAERQEGAALLDALARGTWEHGRRPSA